MKFLKQILFIFVCLIFFSSVNCRKDKELPSTFQPVYIPQELKDYMYFKPGTYWIYKDDSSGSEDSVYITSAINNIDTVYENGRIKGIWEWFQTNTKSSYDGYDYAYYCDASWNGGCNPNLSEPCFRVTRIKSQPGNYVGQAWIFLYHPKIGNYLYDWGGGIIKVKQLIDSLSIDSVTYYDVVIMNNTQDVTEGDRGTDYYILKQYGIIKKVGNIGQSWSLARYKIQQ